jgi:hypothetical protein
MRIHRFTSILRCVSIGGAFTLLVGLAGIVVPVVPVAPARAAEFGFVPGSTTVTARNADGTIDTQAGSHPASFIVHFKLKTDESGHTEGGRMRNVVVDLPPGFMGNPRAVPACSHELFEGLVPACPADTQVGLIHATLPGLGEIKLPVYNLVPPPGTATQLAFSGVELTSLQPVTVRTEEGYGLHFAALNAPLEASEITETIWGVPAAKYNDARRGQVAAEENGIGGQPVPSTAPENAYLTLPASCGEAPKTTVSVDTVEEPNHYVSETVEAVNDADQSQPMSGCNAVPFDPEVASQSTTKLAGSPSGLDFTLKLPDRGLTSPDGTTETEPSKVTVALPEGFTANPSFAEGIVGCSEAQYHAEQLETPAGEGCLETSKLGSVTAYTPLLEEPAEGSLYLAEPYKNKFGSLLAIYMVLRAPERGVLIKQAGHVEPDPVTGRLVTTFENLPPVPYSSFHLHFREGARAPLATPPTCGQFETVTELTPFSSDEPVKRDSFFQIEHGEEGGPCPAGGTPPFNPGLIGGTANNAAGAYSPLDLRITRKDGEQEITGFTTQLPEGLTANLSGIPLCSEAQIALARTKTGTAEQAEPSCPAASEIGHTQVGVGVGTVLAYAPGKMYLGGSFEGAPFSIVSISAAKVGPFDLGTVVVHLPLRVDPLTAAVSIPSGPADQIPHIIDGIIVHVRDIQVMVDREHFTLNPTSCAKKTISATVYGSGQNFSSPADDVPANASSPFQAADCASLAFSPGFKVSTSGKTSRAHGASLHVEVTYPKETLGKDANIAKVKVDLPKQLPSRLTTLQKACTAAQFEANPAGCPKESFVGYARAVTPILPVPLEGPAIFVGHGGEAFPSLIMVLQGYGITIDLVGTTFINKAGITSSTFSTVPDQPVSSFELTLPEGKYSALAANGDLCTSKLKMPTAFVAQNGAEIHESTPIAVTGCAKTKTLTRAQKLKRALKECHKDKNKHQRAGCEGKAREKYAAKKQTGKEKKK